jgi:ubiquinone/menaquinone biosynthesis C-methylase UbiE
VTAAAVSRLGSASAGAGAPAAVDDRWSCWLLDRRYGGDPDRRRARANHFRAAADRILAHATLGDGDVLLDVGCGEGLIAFAALEQVGRNARVILSDVSQPLLDRCRATATTRGVLDRCRFVRAPAEDLGDIPSASVDVITTRSVLIYVADKQRAFDEFHRVLKLGGRLSICEPIARFFGFPPPPHLFGWQTLYDVTPIMEIAAKVQAVYAQVRSPESPMMGFDERDLVAFAEAAGFDDIRLRMHVEIRHARPLPNWDATWRRAPNPLAPTLAEAVQAALPQEEAKEFVAHLRPLVERGQGQKRSAVAYLRAVR